MRVFISHRCRIHIHETAHLRSRPRNKRCCRCKLYLISKCKHTLFHMITHIIRILSTQYDIMASYVFQTRTRALANTHYKAHSLSTTTTTHTDEGLCRPAAAVSKLGYCAVPDAAPRVGSGGIPCRFAHNSSSSSYSEWNGNGRIQ